MIKFQEEKRKHQRVIIIVTPRCNLKINQIISYSDNQTEFNTSTLDLSEGGVALTMSEYLPVGSDLIIKFGNDSNADLLDTENEFILISGKIRNITPVEEGRYRAGVSFAPMSEANRLRFLNYIRLRDNCF